MIGSGAVPETMEAFGRKWGKRRRYERFVHSLIM
jgi:hypothetical protein